MTISTEPIGSIPRPPAPLTALETLDSADRALDALYAAALRDTIARFEDTGSPMITDGEQRKYHNFWTYSVHGMPNTAPDGFAIPFAAGHVRRMPRLTAGPFRSMRTADQFLDYALSHVHVPAKQAVISPFCDDTSTSRDTAFAKVRSRVQGTAMAAREIGIA